MSYAVGVHNGNFRSGEYQAWATQDLSNVPTFTQFCDVEKAVRSTFETQEAFDAWKKDAPKYDGFFAYAEDYLLECIAQDRQNILVTRRDSILAAFKEEPVDKETALELIDELAEIETALQGSGWVADEELPF